MNDRQIQSAGAYAAIPVVSPVLHWLSMPAIVFLRSGFGYSFLRPKSVFLVFSYASVLFALYAWNRAGGVGKDWAVVLFSVGASLLYSLNLAFTSSTEARKKAKHDHYAGTSHVLRLPGLDKLRADIGFVIALHIWMEPFLVLIAATALRAFLSEERLSTWLLIVAPAMWLKELYNWWSCLRAEKKQGDIMEDAEDRMAGAAGSSEAPLPSSGGRKPRASRPPQSAVIEPELEAKEQHYAELLRLMPPRPPWDLQQAEHNYRELIKDIHPDPNDATPEATRKTAEMNDAIAFFRQKLGG